jgi:hypothetical protein
MKLPIALVVGAVMFLFSTGCVLYEEFVQALPEMLYFPLYPGIWVGVQVHHQITTSMPVCYAAGIATMTIIGTLLGLAFDCLPSRGNADRH